MTTTAIKVFLCHNSGDKDIVERLAHLLRDEPDIEPWLDKWHVAPGDLLQEALEQSLRGCNVFLACVGSGKLGFWQNEEMRVAISRREKQRDFRVVPVLLPGAQRPAESGLPEFLERSIWAEFRKGLDDDEAMHRLLCGVRGIAPGPGRRGAAFSGDCPYVGLRPFKSNEAHLFFGRQREIEWRLANIHGLIADPQAPKLLAIVGASGSGKSSLVRAGLLPKIRDGEIATLNPQPIELRPSNNPLEQLWIALGKWQAQGQSLPPSQRPPLPKYQDFRSELLSGSDEAQVDHGTLHRWLRLLNPNEDSRALLVVDQFEEVFTLCDSSPERQAFIDALLRCTASPNGSALVLLTMRDDFWGKCASHQQLKAMLGSQSRLVSPLDEAELREAIEAPASAAGLTAEAGLTELLLRDMAGSKGALPLMQHALAEMWRNSTAHSSKPALTLAGYHELGGLEGALAKHAEAVLKKSQTIGEAGCRALFQRLVRPGEGTEDTRRIVRLAELPDNQREIALQLVDARLLVAEGLAEVAEPAVDPSPAAKDSSNQSANDATVEISHEALIRGWPTLQQWINADREQSQLLHRLADAALEWVEQDQPEELLWRGSRLARAQELLESDALSLSLGEASFISAGVDLEGFQQREEQQRQQQKIEQQQQEITHNRRIKRLTGLLAAVAVVAAVALGWGLFVQARSASLSEEKEQVALKAADDAAASRNRLAQQNSQSKFLLASLYLDDDPAKGMAHLASALRDAPNNHAAEQRGWDWLQRRSSPVATRLISALYHTGIVQSVAFSPDGRWIVTGSNNKTARVWDAASGQPTTEPLPHEGAVLSVAFNPDGRQVVTGSRDHTARVWNLAYFSTAAQDWIASFFEKTGGGRLDESGTFQRLAPISIAELRRQASELPAGERERWLDRMLADRSTRRISPWSSITVPEYIDRRLQENTAESLKLAYVADSGHPLVNIATAGYEKNQDQAKFLAEHGVNLLTFHHSDVCKRAVAMLKQQGRTELVPDCDQAAAKRKQIFSDRPNPAAAVTQ